MGLVAGVMVTLSQQHLPRGCDLAGSQQVPPRGGGEAFTHPSEPHPFTDGSLGESGPPHLVLYTCECRVSPGGGDREDLGWGSGGAPWAQPSLWALR